MPIQLILTEFSNEIVQCDNLIVNAHQQDAHGNSLLPEIDRKQITVAAFLNLFIAWETFLERSMCEFMTGGATISGRTPVKFVAPHSHEEARKMLIGVMRYFDFGNHDNVRKMIRVYFDSGYPYEPHLSSLVSELNDLRTMRNASAHLTSTTQTALEALANSIFGSPRPGIELYQLLTAVDPRSGSGDTVFVSYRDKLTVTAGLIAQG